MTIDRTQYETHLDPDRQTHLGLWRDERAESYTSFFDWEVPELPDYVRAAIASGMQAAENGVNLENLDTLLRPGYLPMETGIARCANGELSVAILTRWPGATPAMIDWWMGWHMSRTDRYKLWHPQAHVFSQAKYDLSDVPGLTDRERYVGNTSWVDEYVGPLLSRLAITFHDPADIGLDEPALAASGHGTALCAEVSNSDNGQPLSRLIHAVRPTPYGCEMRSRFIFPPVLPEILGGWMIDHCATEMSHLAAFLPRLYVHVTAPVSG